jgi:DNA-binding transcriptional LysR family regulator
MGKLSGVSGLQAIDEEWQVDYKKLMKMSPSQITAFLAVLRSGSLSGAARELGRSQPTVRGQIADLERRLATPLFTRSRTGLTPTARALDLRGRAEAVEAAAEAFARSASGPEGQIVGHVRLTASRVMATHVVPRVMSPMTARYPQLTIELAATDRVEDLTRQDADIALRLTEPRQSALIIRKLRPVRLGFFAAPCLVARYGQPAVPADLMACMPFVFEDRGRRITEGLAASGLPFPVHVALATDDDLAQIAAVEAGIGSGIVQIGVAESMGLARLLPDLSFDLPLWAAMHEDQRPSARVRAVFDHLVGALG